MRRLGLATGFTVALLTVSACATLTVGSHVARGLDIARYRTWDWGVADALPTGDPRLDQNAFFQDHMHGAIDKQMAAKGFVRSATETPDLLLHYHASITRRLDVSAADRGRRSCQGLDCVDEVREFEAGTLVIDILDVRTNRVVWRGWAQGSFDGVLENPDRLARKINEAVPRILASFQGER